MGGCRHRLTLGLLHDAVGLGPAWATMASAARRASTAVASAKRWASMMILPISVSVG